MKKGVRKNPHTKNKINIIYEHPKMGNYSFSVAILSLTVFLTVSILSTGSCTD